MAGKCWKETTKQKFCECCHEVKKQFFFSWALISFNYFKQIFGLLLKRNVDRANFGSLWMHEEEKISVSTQVFSPRSLRGETISFAHSDSWKAFCAQSTRLTDCIAACQEPPAMLGKELPRRRIGLCLVFKTCLENTISSMNIMGKGKNKRKWTIVRKKTGEKEAEKQPCTNLHLFTACQKLYLTSLINSWMHRDFNLQVKFRLRHVWTFFVAITWNATFN